MIQFLPSELEMLHIAGVFQYEKIQLLFFISKLALFLITFSFILLCIYVIISKRFLKYKYFRPVLYIVSGISIILCLYIYPDVISKLYFARGYYSYLNFQDTKACDYYFKSLDANSSFIYAMDGLIDIYKENSKDDSLLKKIAEKAENVDSEIIHLQIGKLFEGKGKLDKSLLHYKKARALNPSHQNSIKIIDNLIALNNIIDAENELKGVLDKGINSEFREQILYYSSLIDYTNGDYTRAEETIKKVLNTETTDPVYYIHHGKILIKLGDYNNALESFSQAITLKRELPEAYFEMAKIYYSRKDYDLVRETLCKTIYYDNCNSLAYVMLQMAIAKRWLSIDSIMYDDSIKPIVNNGQQIFRITKGNSLDLKADIRNIAEKNRVDISILEPYGFGLKSEVTGESEKRQKDEIKIFSKRFKIEALRSSRINFNQPWILNIISFDIEKGSYYSQRLSITVDENEDEEGRILHVITEDFEQTSDFPHSDNTPDIQDIDPYEIETDLIKKGTFADSLAKRYGIKWSHIIDIGSAFLRLKWIKENDYGGEWDTLWGKMDQFLYETLSSENDVQLHIHAYSIPDNKLFRQYFDPDKNKIFFKNNIVRTVDDNGFHGAWAANYSSLGSYDEPDSRIGSIFRGIKLLEGQFHEKDTSYRTIFFRAGEYEFGIDEDSVRKSCLALIKNKILCSSDAYSGSPFKKDFKFFARVGENVYFSRPDTIREKAVSLLDIGIMQILPVHTNNANNYIRPIDNWRNIKYNYDNCISDGKIKNDIFILMEMYHLNNVNWAYQWDRIDENYEDWKRLKEHFDGIKENCPQIEFVTISDAIKIYLERYSPDIIALRTNEAQINEKLYSYEVVLLGKDIEVSDLRPHFVSIKPPSYFVGKIKKIELIHNNTLKKTWYSIKGYQDLEFTINSKKDYKIKVYLD